MSSTSFISPSLPYFSVVVAVTPEHGIGLQNQLPWSPKKLYVDMTFFKLVTSSYWSISTSDKVNNTLKKDVFSIEKSESSFSRPKNVVILGRKTWQSIRTTPLKDRINIVLSRDPNFVIEHSSVVVCNSLDDAITYITKSLESFAHVMVIGGSQIYEEAIHHPLCRYVFLTRVFGEFASDVFFSCLESNFISVCM